VPRQRAPQSSSSRAAATGAKGAPRAATEGRRQAGADPAPQPEAQPAGEVRPVEPDPAPEDPGPARTYTTPAFRIGHRRYGPY
jgi:hypothetical protein